MQVQLGHSREVSALSVSHNGRLILSGSQDASVKLWDVDTGKLINSLSDNGGAIMWVAFGPDDSWFMTYSYGSYRKRETATGRILKTIDIMGWRSALSNDGRYLAAGMREGNIQIIDLQTGKVIRNLEGHKDLMGAVAFSPDGKTLLSGTEDRTIRLWDVGSGKTIKVFSPPPGSITSLSFSSGGNTFISASYTAESNTIQHWDVKVAKPIKTISGIDGWVTCLLFSADDKSAISGISYGGTPGLHKYDLSTSKDTFSKIGNLYALAVSSDFLVAGGGKLSLFDTVTLRELKTLRRFSEPITAVQFSADGTAVLSSSEDGGMKIWDIVSGKAMRSFAEKDRFNPAAFSPYVRKAVFSPDEKSIFTLRLSDIQIWNVASGTTLKGFYPGHFDTLAFSPDCRLAAGGDNSGQVAIVDIGNKKVVKVMKGLPSEARVNAVAFSGDGKRVFAAGSSPYSVLSWDVASSKRVTTYKGHKDSILSLAVSPDDTMVASGSRDRTIKLWELETGKLIKTLSGHGDEVISLAFSRDGRLIASGSGDKMIRIWDVATGNTLHILKGHSDKVTVLSFSPDGTRLASGSGAGDNTMRIWNTATGMELFASLSSVSGEWISWTPEGYWDGSPGCGEFVAMVKGLDVWNIDQFAVLNNRPDLIVERTRGAPELAAEFRAAWHKRLRKLGLKETDIRNDYKVPRAAIVQAKQDTTSRNGKFVDLSLSFSAEGKPLTRYQVYVNDVPLFGTAGKALAGNVVSLTERIELTQGNNKIEVSCMDSGGTESFRANRIFTWTGDAPPNLYYLAFGVSDYADSNIRDLKYAAKDALSLEELYKGMAGKSYGQVFTRVFTDDKVTRSAIVAAKDFLKEAHPDDTFVLFISGHGIQVSGSGSAPTAAGGRTYYYVTADAKLSDIANTAADFDTIEDLLQGIAPRQKLFLMDTCESGEADESNQRLAQALNTKGLSARTLSPESTRGLSVIPSAIAKISTQRDRWIYNDLARRSGSIVFSSSRGNEASLESDAWNQGAFTYSILQAFRESAADRDKNGLLSTDELRAYVIDAVPKLVRQLDPEAQQHPTVDRDNIYAKFGFPVVTN
ncbi:MAG: caspase family protein [Treponemataceae bacterium]